MLMLWSEAPFNLSTTYLLLIPTQKPFTVYRNQTNGSEKGGNPTHSGPVTEGSILWKTEHHKIKVLKAKATGLIKADCSW